MATMTAVRATVKEGNLEFNVGDLSLFPDDTEVIIMSRKDFNTIAGNDSARHQLSEAKQELANTRRALTIKTNELAARDVVDKGVVER